MSRRHAATIRKTSPDPKFNSIMLAKFINNVTKNGAKSLASSIVYNALSLLERKYDKDPIEVFNKAMENATPLLEVKSLRVGGSNYQVPHAVESRRSTILATRWLIKASQKRPEKSMVEKLAEELFEASCNKGGAVKMKDDSHKVAEANRAFAHFAVKRKKV
ncbi:30S ribosomal protein S7 [Candidatus Sneabacter namystus]|uniref:Small ribosomal subunit protein uS7 n=1 Tax=Candidatus Sneabacter namystus TaxID=2601646 RepID=A0A5C0UIB6_9RICK|nr:30S ribosomal protein S7 [Candidatus Sneabacter namystus]QEK39816.1 30S ribosomal protein S7 [Candidatus Sneabacter namystus]